MSSMYRYSDPLAASWMEDKFGMQFVCSHGNDIWICESRYFCVTEECECQGMTDIAFVGEDSLHLLEPVVGDLVIDPIGTPTLINMVTQDGYLIDGSPFACHKSQCKIIQRQGIPFMYPEKES